MSGHHLADAPEVLQTAMLRWLDELAEQAIFTTDEELVIRSWNLRLETHTGRSAPDVIGTPLFTAFPALVIRKLDEHYRAALAGEPRVLAQRFHQYFLANADGVEVPQTARIAPLRAGDSIIGTITVIDDVADRVASERELRKRIEAAETARAIAENAVQVKDEFLATLSHELRTPLNAVLGWTKILLARPVEPATLSRALNVIDRNAAAQMRLIDDMLDMARVVSGKLRLEMQPVDLAVVALGAVDVVAPTAAAKDIKILTEVAADGAWMTGDSDRLQQVVWNLLSNAVKFTDRFGTVTLRVEGSPEGVRLIVADTGAGIDPAFLPRMFDRFRQADPSASRRHGGLGLGLALVRQLVELHGGTVEASSVLGEGSTFVVSFPSARRDAFESAEPPLRESVTLAGTRVLAVDDQEDAREILAAALEHHSVEVTAVSSCRAALDALDASIDAGRPPHVIVADIGLPDEDGFWLIEQLGRRAPSRGGSIPVIAVTAYGHPGDRRRALAAGFRLHLTKPISPDTLADSLAQLLGVRR